MRNQAASDVRSAAFHGDFTAVQNILNSIPSADLPSFASSLLPSAVVGGNLKFVEMLLASGASDPDNEALGDARYFCRGDIEQLLLRRFHPRLVRNIPPQLQDEFDRFWVSATQMQRRGRLGDSEIAIKHHVLSNMLAVHPRLEAEDFFVLEMEFRRNWRPSFEKGWERMFGEERKPPHFSATQFIEADELISHMNLPLAGWEQTNLSVCLIDQAIKGGLSGPYDEIRDQVREKYVVFADKKKVILETLSVLLAEYSKPNIFAPSKPLIERSRNLVDAALES